MAKKFTGAEEEFEAIGIEASQKAARVECSPSEYREGLLGIIETLRTDMRASEETDHHPEEG